MPEAGHSLLPPSSAFRWTVCTSSVRYVEENDAILPPSGGAEADEGTRAHAYLTYLLNSRATVAQPDNSEMDRLMRSARDYVLRFVGKNDQLAVDQKVPLFYLPRQKGTLDVGIQSLARLVIYDLKYGKGVSVQAVRNKQLAIYGESWIRFLEEAYGEFDPATPVMLIIDQPRDRNDSSRFRSWPITRGELRAFCEKEISPAAKLILSGGKTKFVPGEPCKFCRATGACVAYATQGLEVVSDESVDTVLARPQLSLTDARSLTREQRQKVLAFKHTIEHWLDEVEKQEIHDLLQGATPIRHKLVHGKANRIWRDVESAKQFLNKFLPESVYFPAPQPELVSPAQAEGLIEGIELSEDGKKAFYSLIEKPNGKPTLVPVEDKRPAITINPTEGLSVIEDADSMIG